jgi:hypothetical protein
MMVQGLCVELVTSSKKVNLIIPQPAAYWSGTTRFWVVANDWNKFCFIFFLFYMKFVLHACFWVLAACGEEADFGPFV